MSSNNSVDFEKLQEATDLAVCLARLAEQEQPEMATLARHLIKTLKQATDLE